MFFSVPPSPYRWFRISSRIFFSFCIGCSEICHSGPILMFIKPICLYEVLMLQKKNRQRICWLPGHFLGRISIPWRQIGLISIKIGPLSHILGHPNLLSLFPSLICWVSLLWAILWQTTLPPGNNDISFVQSIGNTLWQKKIEWWGEYPFTWLHHKVLLELNGEIHLERD